MHYKFNCRNFSQIYFLSLFLVAGYFLYKALILLPVLGLDALKYRFPSLEGFLPISSTVGLRHWILTGEYDSIHPAGLTILLLAIISALLLKRGFCSHICPIGTISEYAYKIRMYFFKFKLPLPTVLTVFLRIPKYLLLGFLLMAVFIFMSPEDISKFIRSPYNIIAEVKMMYFFLEPSALTIKVLAGLIILSLLISNFWCRFLCPYGALLSLFSYFSPVAISRNKTNCVSCHACEKACPSQLKITTVQTVSSTECTICQNCINACPRSALKIQSKIKKHFFSNSQYSCLLLGIFILGISIAVLSGYWNSAELPPYWVKYAPLADKIFH